jgi:bisphosphoglycerate-dependent phosphoglycerate mutase
MGYKEYNPSQDLIQKHLLQAKKEGIILGMQESLRALNQYIENKFIERESITKKELNDCMTHYINLTQKGL